MPRNETVLEEIRRREMWTKIGLVALVLAFAAFCAIVQH